LPIGKLNNLKVQSILRKFPLIHHFDKENILKMRATFPNRIHSIFKNPYHVYEIKTIQKKKMKLDTKFNAYKWISRKEEKPINSSPK
jgi:hypothetical protein